MYYPNKGGLQDRVFRIRTERSSATSLPEPRTTHNISNVEILEQVGDTVKVRFNWHTMYFRYNTVDPYYGTSFYTIDFSGSAPQIKSKRSSSRTTTSTTWSTSITCDPSGPTPGNPGMPRRAAYRGSSCAADAHATALQDLARS